MWPHRNDGSSQGITGYVFEDPGRTSLAAQDRTPCTIALCLVAGPVNCWRTQKKLCSLRKQFYDTCCFGRDGQLCRI